MTIKPNLPQDDDLRAHLSARLGALRDQWQIRQKPERTSEKRLSFTMPDGHSLRHDRILAALILVCFLLSALVYGVIACVKYSQNRFQETKAALAPVGTQEMQAEGSPAIESSPAEEPGSQTEEATQTPTSPYTPPEDPALRYGMYQQTLVVVGDSIASGFHLYDFIPDEHGLAHGSVAIRSLHDYTFTYEGQEVDVMDAIAGLQPPYLYMSMGMNDINMSTAEEYTTAYRGEIEQILEISPETNVVVAGITPIEAGCTFTTNEKIRQYNLALEEMAASFQQPNVVYFDAYGAIADPNTQALGDAYTAGDGVHVYIEGYAALLEALYPVLDQMPYTAACDAAMEAYQASTEPPTEPATECASEAWNVY